MLLLRLLGSVKNFKATQSTYESEARCVVMNQHKMTGLLITALNGDEPQIGAQDAQRNALVKMNSGKTNNNTRTTRR